MPRSLYAAFLAGTYAAVLLLGVLLAALWLRGCAPDPEPSAEIERLTAAADSAEARAERYRTQAARDSAAAAEARIESDSLRALTPAIRTRYVYLQRDADDAESRYLALRDSASASVRAAACDDALAACSRARVQAGLLVAHLTERTHNDSALIALQDREAVSLRSAYAEVDKALGLQRLATEAAVLDAARARRQRFWYGLGGFASGAALGYGLGYGLGRLTD